MTFLDKAKEMGKKIYVRENGEYPPLCPHVYGLETLDESQAVCHAVEGDCIKCYAREYKPEAPDPIAKHDAGKPRLSLVPMQIVWDCAEVREYGTAKYKDPENWRKVELQRYVDALLRHVMALAHDIRAKDPESGIEHYKHAECNLSFISALLEEEKNA